MSWCRISSVVKRFFLLECSPRFLWGNGAFLTCAPIMLKSLAVVGTSESWVKDSCVCIFTYIYVYVYLYMRERLLDLRAKLRVPNAVCGLCVCIIYTHILYTLIHIDIFTQQSDTSCTLKHASKDHDTQGCKK